MPPSAGRRRLRRLSWRLGGRLGSAEVPAAGRRLAAAGAPPPVPGVAGVFFLRIFLLRAPACWTGGATGATGTPVAPVGPVAPLLALERAACRGSSSTDSMKSCQISAGIGAAGHRLAAVLGLHRLRALRVADPHRDGELVVEADEPGVLVVLGGPGLARGELADLGAAAGARS